MAVLAFQKKPTKKESGQMMLEAIIAVSVLAGWLILTYVAFLNLSGRSNLSLQTLQASNSVNEGLEAVKSVGADNWLNLIKKTGDFGLAASGNKWQLTQSAEEIASLPGGQRKITISEQGPDFWLREKKITSEVSWQPPVGSQRKLKAETLIADWKSDISYFSKIHTTAGDFGAGTFNQTAVSGSGTGGSVKLGAVLSAALRPNAAGDVTQLTPYSGTGAANWQNADEETADDNVTYNKHTNPPEGISTAYDLYALSDYAGTDNINSVTVYYRYYGAAGGAGSGPSRVTPRIKTGGIEYDGATTLGTWSWQTQSYAWNVNPKTGSAWTRSDINSLQAGAYISRGGETSLDTKLTQVYVEVNYSAYYPSGTFTSNIVDIGENSDFTTLGFTIAEPAGTDLKFQLRTADAPENISSAAWQGPAGTDDFYENPVTIINPVHTGQRFVQYKADFSASLDQLSTPKLEDATIYYYQTP